MAPVMYLVVPCCNEEAVLPLTAPLFLEKLRQLVGSGKISDSSRILFVDDGSRDATWPLVCQLAREDPHYTGIRLRRNLGQQRALLAGMLEARDRCDALITLDCDGQDDISAMDAMVARYREGFPLVCGVRSDRSSDPLLKRLSAQAFYRLMQALGRETVYNHADYRLASREVLLALPEQVGRHVYLRGLFPKLGFQSTCVPYVRRKRLAGRSHYSLKRMLGLALAAVAGSCAAPADGYLRDFICARTEAGDHG